MQALMKGSLSVTLLRGMRRAIAGFALALVVCLGCSSAMGETIVPPDPDLDDLDHYKYYTWGIDTPWDPAVEEVVTAELFFDHIRNHNDRANDLWIHLLDDAPLGITIGTDNQGGGDAFSGQGILLVHYEDLSSTPQDLTYVFSDAEVEALNTYAVDGRFGLGFDPDCHFYNCGVELRLQTQVIPEPATLLIVGAGGLVVLARKRKRS